MQEKTIGEKIREYRQKQGLTQDALAAELHISSQAISKWETGQTMPDINLLVPLSKVLEIGVNELLGGDRREELEKKYHDAEDLSEEITLLVAEEALAEFPDDEKFLYRRAYDEYRLGKLDAEQPNKSNYYFSTAKLHLEELIRRFPENENYRDLLARTCFMLGEKKEALRIAYSLRNRTAQDDLIYDFSTDEEKEILRQRKLKPMLTGMLLKLRNYKTREAITAAYGLIDVMCGDDTPLRNHYYREVCVADALLCLDEGNLEGYSAKLSEAYKAAREIDFLPNEDIRYTAPLFNKLTFNNSNLWHPETNELLYDFLNEKKLAHPASAEIRRRMAEECFLYVPLPRTQWKKYFRFCRKYICDAFYSNYSTGYYVTEGEAYEKFQSMRGKPNGHARFVEIHKDEVEKFIKSGVMRGYVAACGEEFVAFCHCAHKDSLKQQYRESAAAPEGSRILSIIDVLVADNFKCVGVEEKLLTTALDAAKRSGYTHAEIYMRERMWRPSDAEHFEFMIALYKKLGFEVARDLSSENGGRYYIMRKTLRTGKPDEYFSEIAKEKYNEILGMLKKKKYDILPGMASGQISTVERAYGFNFPTSLADFYSCGVPMPKSSISDFPDWWNFDPQNVSDIKKRISDPMENLVEEVKEGFWINAWGERPENDEDAFAIFKSHAEKAPKLIPIYSHRYIPVIEGVDDPPVISAVGQDIIYYGCNLSNYMKNEFVGFTEPIDHGKIIRIPFWSDIIDNFLI
jgi:transcriptional regulator with XRE-family HTH domain/ribosomal protein S18 acetylase RimI-like enzyme